MQHRLQNSFFTAVINYHGAELCSLKDAAGIEYFWQANENIWARHAPVLFPIVGRLKENAYAYKGNSYSLPQHGFARDCLFNWVEGNDDYVIFQLSASSDTLQKFPFDFDLQIKYELNQNVLITRYRICNNGTQEMYFSIGAHPAFNCPLMEYESFTDYFLQFDTDAKLQTILKDGLLSHEKRTITLQNGILELSLDLFDSDALVFEDNQVNSIKLQSKLSGRGVELECKDWPYFGIWTKKQCNRFICLEPWYGITDSITANQNLEEKKGIIALESGKEFDTCFSLKFF